MWILTIVLVAASLGALAAPVEAADLYTGPLDGGAFYCSATNKSAVNLTMTLSIVAAGSASPLMTCGPVTVGGKQAAVCTHANPTSAAAYCKITTSNSLNTRGNLMVLDIQNNATATSEAK